MRRTIARIHRVLARIILLGLVLEFYFAGLGLFGAESLDLHRTFGMLMAVPIWLLLILALAGRLGRHLIGLSALLVVLTIAQAMLPSLRGDATWIAALHPINALALMGLSDAIARRGWTEASVEATQPPTTGRLSAGDIGHDE